MELIAWTKGDILIVEVFGWVDRSAAGEFYDVLVGYVGSGWTKMVVDFTDVVMVTRAGVRGLIVAAKLLRSVQGEMRICVADDATTDFLNGLGFAHLLKCDATLVTSIALLGGDTGPSVDSPAISSVEFLTCATFNQTSAFQVTARPDQSQLRSPGLLTVGE